MIYAQAALLHVAWASARLMIGVAAADRTTDAVLLALIAAGFAMPAVALALPLGAAMDRFGPRALVLVGIAVATLAVLLAALGPDLPLLVATNALLGIGHLLCMIGQQGAVAGDASGGALDGAVGSLTSAMAVGQLLGPIVGTSAGTLLHSAIDAPAELGGLIASAACLLAALPLAVRMRGSSGHPRAHRPAPAGWSGALVPGMWRALFVSGIVLATVDLLFVFLPAWADERGVNVLAVGWLLSLRAAVTVMCRFGLDGLVRRCTRAGVLAGALVLGVGGFLLLALGTLPLAIVAMVVLGAALGIPQPLTLSWVMRLADASTRGRALGMRVASNRVMQVVLPLIVGAAAAPLGAAGVFVGSAIAMAGAAAVSIVSRRQLDAG